MKIITGLSARIAISVELGDLNEMQDESNVRLYRDGKELLSVPMAEIPVNPNLFGVGDQDWRAIEAVPLFGTEIRAPAWAHIVCQVR